MTKKESYVKRYGRKDAHVWLEPDKHKALKDEADRRESSISGLIRDILDEYIEKEGLAEKKDQSKGWD